MAYHWTVPRQQALPLSRSGKSEVSHFSTVQAEILGKASLILSGSQAAAAQAKRIGCCSLTAAKKERHLAQDLLQDLKVGVI